MIPLNLLPGSDKIINGLANRLNLFFINNVVKTFSNQQKKTPSTRAASKPLKLPREPATKKVLQTLWVGQLLMEYTQEWTEQYKNTHENEMYLINKFRLDLW